MTGYVFDVHDMFRMEQFPRFSSHIFCFRHAVDLATTRGFLLTLEDPIAMKLPSLITIGCQLNICWC